VIAFHSPMGVFKTGLLERPREKKAAKLASDIEKDTFSSPVSQQESRNSADFLHF
jgi:hypothetical protein